ncbi:NTP transferase domain-containing protein [Phycicoccus sp. CSK15P-2]|uniref:molybdenum cofactor guanylyltransferase n=1 Tax=Phycicoccus sp. CSK15P-2 TaxID=2807627 RepID=UPI00194DD5C8|nr:NTP transferase domain-containing protein [Phycicoccus sp. CSK15P-2]MBM6404401.1 NTP transferase domain-containing protein [Phycicoccus sp. CSK15P-2]
MTAAPSVTALVLTGGRSERFGSDKLAAPLRGTTVLGTLLGSLPPGWPVVGVGAPRDVEQGVTWVQEDPPGAGPLAAVLAGARQVRTDLAVVVAGDMPGAAPALTMLVDVLTGAGPEVEAAVGTDDERVPNPLLAVYRTRALATFATRPAGGGPARALLELPHVEVLVAGAAAHDVDTMADLAAFEDGT